MPQWTPERPLRVATGFTYVCFEDAIFFFTKIFPSIHFVLDHLSDGSQIYEREWIKVCDIFNS